jgi:tripeptide aminopeptidase
MAWFGAKSAYSKITTLASLRPVHEAFAWLHNNPKTLLDWQAEMIAIPAPPFGEQARGAWFAERFREIGADAVEIDGIGNVLALLLPPDHPAESTGPIVVLSAHLDTVFPAETDVTPKVDGERIEAPGACDNAAGLVGVLAVAKAIIHSKIPLAAPLCLMANVGEEGEGDLRGVRYFYEHSPLAGRVAAHIVLDGAGAEPAVTQGLGSRRFQIALHGPGGHSFTDAGAPNPIAAVSMALNSLWRTDLPEEPRTTMNLGVIHGGASVNAIPESVSVSVDFRSTNANQLDRLEAVMRQAVDDAVDFANKRAKKTGDQQRKPLTAEIRKIGDRPSAILAEDAILLEMLHAVDRHMNIATDPRLGSTDANLPLSLGVPAISLGAGGDGGGAHTLAEWYSTKDREIGLKRILLLTLAMLESAVEI